MPGTTVWTGGGGDGAWATAGNWNAISGSAPPANGDTVIIGSTNYNIHGATVATTTLTIKILSSYGGIIGDNSPLIFSSGMTLLEYCGSGAYANFGCDGGTTAAANFTHTGSMVSLTGGTWTAVNNGSGRFTVAEAAIVVTLRNASGTGFIGYNATAITTLKSSGPITCARSITTTTLNRSTLTHVDNGTTTYTSAGTATVGNGATFNKRSGGTETLVEVLPGGVLSVVGTSGGAGGSVTFTNATYWGGSTIIDRVPGLVVTYTNPVSYIGIPAAGQASLAP